MAEIWTPRGALTFEYDDFPRDAAHTLAFLDAAKTEFPGFRASLFCIPAEMTAADWKEIDARREWVEACPHGFLHERGECHSRKWREREHLLNQITNEAGRGMWAWLFRAPWSSYCRSFIDALAFRGFAVAVESLKGLSSPAPADVRVWQTADGRWEKGFGENAIALHFLGHPRYDDPVRRVKSRKTELSEKRIANLLCYWRAARAVAQGRLEGDLRWEFVSRLTRPARLKISLGCGRHVWDDWACLDHLPMDTRVVPWKWPQPIPFAECSADIIFTSHFLNYLSADEGGGEYESLFLDCWRVLREGGVLRVSEDETASGRSWAPPGSCRGGQGVIKSEPSRRRVLDALMRVGFAVRDASPGETCSPCKDVLRGDSRNRLWVRGQKFYLEGIKRIKLPPHGKRLAHHDCRRTKKGRYVLPPALPWTANETRGGVE